ncbi:S-adenosyl-L-methionine-dependent methyltransferase, partial [Dimargaris cristalligena]
NDWSANHYKEISENAMHWAGEILQILQANVPSDAKVLDLGCGDGVLTMQLQKQHDRVVGVDLSPALLEAAKQLGVMDTRIADGADLQAAGIGGEEFDAIFSHYALHWMAQDPGKVVREMHRCLKPNGLLVAKFGAHHSVSTLRGVLAAIMDSYGVAELPNLLYFPTADEYRDLLEKTGFEVETAEATPWVGHFPFTIRQYIDTFIDPCLGDWGDANQRKDVADRMEQYLTPVMCRNGKFYANYVHLVVVARK